MSETKLKPCPFCGGKAEKRVSFPCDEDGMEMNMYIIGCKMCDIEFNWLWDEEKAIQQWNTLKPIENIVKELEEWTFNADVNLGDGTVKNSDLIASENAIDIVKRGGVNDD